MKDEGVADKTAETDVSILEKLFDSDNQENIFLFDEEGNEVELEQIAAINYEDEVYAVLHPLDAPEDEVLVFRIDPEDEESVILVEDEKLANEILKKVTQV